jgi:hypothetical protein
MQTIPSSYLMVTGSCVAIKQTRYNVRSWIFMWRLNQISTNICHLTAKTQKISIWYFVLKNSDNEAHKIELACLPNEGSFVRNHFRTKKKCELKQFSVWGSQGDMFFRNVGLLSTDYTALYPIRQNISRTNLTSPTQSVHLMLCSKRVSYTRFCCFLNISVVYTPLMSRRGW